LTPLHTVPKPGTFSRHLISHTFTTCVYYARLCQKMKVLDIIWECCVASLILMFLLITLLVCSRKVRLYEAALTNHKRPHDTKMLSATTSGPRYASALDIHTWTLFKASWGFISSAIFCLKTFADTDLWCNCEPRKRTGQRTVCCGNLVII
jgi:hypothetical protein